MFCVGSVAYGQQGNGNPPPNPGKGKGGPPPPPGLPIDAGITYLLVAGIAYGVYEKRKKS
jgi:hypothetical protein